MGKYRIEIKKSAAKEIEQLSRKDMKAVIGTIGSLSDNPRPHGSKKLSGQEKYRIRCGNYRILYAIEDNVLIVYVVKVGHRKDVYRNI
ncbi:MAG: type II toxin-antitoxin system mRNA interferase toxin, RelE/StbE family [Candidatus Omnitrophica bacterium CG_4_10_14_0_8_um_filter_44_12]|nr:MAG: type II toxin-antitoxin system mRNA interferase toxin, RelE/StbE family [Candidatus Omnitrophica bacterium CG_4_10_14_0_8_um_filter_44_12]